MLKASDKHRLEGDVVKAALELEFPTEEAARQLDTSIRWGRYAELLAYDDNTQSLYLEPAALPPDPLNKHEERGKGL